MITLADYWMGRDAKYPLALTPQIEKNAALMVTLVNALLDLSALANVPTYVNPTTGTAVSSGWRPPQVNDATAHAAPNSKHQTGQACDLYDPEEKMDNWLMLPEGQAALEKVGLWMEHPSATKGWTHVQSVPPGSGHRVFYP